MNAKFLYASGLTALLFMAQVASAQTYAQTSDSQSSAGGLPVVGAQSTFGSGANSYAGTVDGSYLEGVGAAVAGAGQYNLNTAIGANYMEQARARYIQNYRDSIDARYAIKRANDIYRAEQFAKERVSPEMAARIQQAKLPDRLAVSEYNPGTGGLRWPALLMSPQFDADRRAIDVAFAQRRPEDVGMTSTFYRDVSQRTQRMHATMLSQIDSISTADSIAARKFLKSVELEARHLPEGTGLAAVQR